MKEILVQVEKYLDMELEINKANYDFDNKNDWGKIYSRFRERFLSERMQDHWFKIPVEQFSEEKRNRLRDRISGRKIYIIKIHGNDETGKWVNVFCSAPDSFDDLRDCLVFSLISNEIRLYSIETVCESCFGAGYIEEETQRCSRCLGCGFAYSTTLDFVNWKTIFCDAKNVIVSKVFNLPSSEIQKKVISLN